MLCRVWFVVVAVCVYVSVYVSVYVAKLNLCCLQNSHSM